MGMRRLRFAAVSLLLSVLLTASLQAATTSRRPSSTARGPRNNQSERLARQAAARRGTQAGKTGQLAGPHRETTDPEVGRAINAFSAGNYERARTIAEDILGKPDRGTRRSEALDLIVESWLLQGEFGKARAAAHRYSKEAPRASREALVRIDMEEREYQADLKRLEARKRKAKKPEDQAHLQLLIGHTHHAVGRMAEAEKAYREVIAKYPKTKAAGMAQRQLASMGKGGKKPKK